MWGWRRFWSPLKLFQIKDGNLACIWGAGVWEQDKQLFLFLLTKKISLYIWFAFFSRLLPETIVQTEHSLRPKETCPFPWNSPSVWLGLILRFEEFLNMKSSSFKNTAGSLWFISGFSPSDVDLRPSVALERPLHPCLSWSNMDHSLLLLLLLGYIMSWSEWAEGVVATILVSFFKILQKKVF